MRGVARLSGVRLAAVTWLSGRAAKIREKNLDSNILGLSGTEKGSRRRNIQQYDLYERRKTAYY